MSRIVSLIALVTIVVLVGVLSFKVMASFLLPMFLALVLTVIFRPLHKWFIGRCQGYDRVAAGLTTGSILLIVLLPTALILTRAAAEAYTLVSVVNPERARERLQMLRQKFNLEAAAAPDVMESVNTSFTSFQNGMDALETEVAQRDATINPAELVPALRLAADNIHSRLQIGSAPPAKDPVSPETRALITERWNALDARLNELEAAEPRTPEFDAAVGKLPFAFVDFRESIDGSPVVQFIRGQLNPDSKQIENWITTAREYLTGLAVGTGQFLGGVFVGLGVMIISLYYFMADGPAMIRALMHLSPLDDRYEEELLNEFTTISRAVVLATLLSAFAQGLLASIGYFFAGFESVFLLTVITMFLALIPFVGAAAVWGACSVWLLFNNQTTAAICLALYGGLVVSMIDNLIKPMVLHGQSKLHPLLALLSILGGIKALGPIGIFVGPMGVGFLQALLNMLHNELVALDDPAEPPAGKLPPPAATGLPAAPS